MVGWIIEGITGMGKSVIFARLQEKLAQWAPANTKLYFSEHYTERVLEAERKQGTLTPGQVIAHGHDLLGVPAMLAQKKDASIFAGRAGNAEPVVVFDRFVLGLLAEMEKDAVAAGSLAELYGLADRLGLARIILRTAPEHVAQRVISTRLHRNAAWAAHLERLGDDATLAAHFVAMQDRLLDFVDRHGAVIKPQFIDVEADMGVADLHALADGLVAEAFPPG